MRILPLFVLLSLTGCAALGDLLPQQAESFRGCSVQVYTLGSQQFGTLDDNACALDGGRRIRYYELRVEQANRIAVRVGSDDFDTFLYLFSRDGREIASNDDITPFLNTDSRVTQQLEAGRYVIGVSSSNTSGMGRYSLTSEIR
jgi:hypothetical protein